MAEFAMLISDSLNQNCWYGCVTLIFLSRLGGY